MIHHFRAAHPDHECPIEIVAMDNDESAKLTYPDSVQYRIDKNERAEYREAAVHLNFSPVEVICIQHEFGLFGGRAGSHLFHLLRNLRKPVVSVMHTVLSDPEAVVGREEASDYRVATTELIDLSTKVIVLSQTSGRILSEVYGVNSDDIAYVPHGAPDVEYSVPDDHKATVGFSGKTVLLTCGLVGPNKGLETSIDAFSRVADRFPNAVYVILGATHPELKKLHGEQYRISLIQQVDRLGLSDRVIFINEYVHHETLLNFIRACDIYLTPYPKREQVVSGTLSFAAAVARAIISTPYYHAEEMLADGRGVLVPFNDSDTMGAAIGELLDSRQQREEIASRLYEFTRPITWPAVARQYGRLFESVSRGPSLVQTEQNPERQVLAAGLPAFRLDHLAALSDMTGLLRSAVFQIPDRSGGYCTDDNARALRLAALNEEEFERQGHRELLSVYLGFVYYAQRTDGWFANSMSYQRQWLDETVSEDCQGRCLWALGTAATRFSHGGRRRVVEDMLKRALPVALQLKSPQAIAYAILGLDDLVMRKPEEAAYRQLLEQLSASLKEAYRRNRRDDWRWFEPILSYASGKQSMAALAAGWTLEDQELLEIGLESLQFLEKIVWEEGRISLVGSQGWFPYNGTKARSVQEPINAASMVMAYQTAARTTGEKEYLEKMRKAFAWFIGDNDLHVPLFDFATGACCDGLEAESASPHCGANAVVSFLAALTSMIETSQAINLLDRPPMEYQRRSARKNQTDSVQ
jgi:glycosyltransferase involved in cell wall biosynthesis